jgi:hypothetical protein
MGPTGTYVEINFMLHYMQLIMKHIFNETSASE